MLFSYIYKVYLFNKIAIYLRLSLQKLKTKKKKKIQIKKLSLGEQVKREHSKPEKNSPNPLLELGEGKIVKQVYEFYNFR